MFDRKKRNHVYEDVQSDHSADQDGATIIDTHENVHFILPQPS